MKIRSLIQTSVTLMILTACSNAMPTASMPGQSAGTQNAGNQNNQASASQTQTSQTQASTSAGMQAELTAIHEEEAIYADSVAVAEGEAGFSTKALGGELGLDARVRQPLTGPRPAPRRISPEQARSARAAAKAHLALNASDRAKFKQQLKTSGAVTVNADGTLTVDPQAFKAAFSQQMQQRKAQFQENLLKLKARLELRKQVAKEKMQKLYQHEFLTRTSDKVSVTNADGSITETVKISFENSKTGVKRESVLSKTSLNGKLIKSEFQLQESNKAFSRSVTRMMTHNADGSKHLLLDAKTTWTDGRSSERHQERVINADGSATGTGTITRTAKDGSTRTWTFSMNASVSGQITTSASDQSNTEVVVEEQPSGEAVVIVAENGQESASEVNLEAEAAAQASPEASASPAASASPEASASPAAEASPSASPEASASPTAAPAV